MRLETREGKIADPATPEDVSRAIEDLTAFNAFVVLSEDDYESETYVQAAGSIAADFIVERRDGRRGEHYRGDRRVSAADLIALFTAFLRRDESWSAAITWHRVIVDLDAPSA